MVCLCGSDDAVLVVVMHIELRESTVQFHRYRARHLRSTLTKLRIGELKAAGGSGEGYVEGLPAEGIDFRRAIGLYQIWNVQSSGARFNVDLALNRQVQRIKDFRAQAAEHGEVVDSTGLSVDNFSERLSLVSICAFVNDNLLFAVASGNFSGSADHERPVQADERCVVEVAFHDITPFDELAESMGRIQLELASAVDLAVAVSEMYGCASSSGQTFCQPPLNSFNRN